MPDKNRAKASKYAEKRNTLFQKSQEAYRRGSFKQANELSAQAKKYDHLMKRYNRQASHSIINRQNISQTGIVDLHGLYLNEAMVLIKNFINQRTKHKFSRLKIITGSGQHSNNNTPVLKPAIVQFLKDEQYLFETLHNEVVVTF